MRGTSLRSQPSKDLAVGPRAFVERWLNARPKQPWKNFGVMLIVIFGLWFAAGLFFSDQGEPVRPASQDKAVTNNLRAIKAAADQYFLDHPGVSAVALATLVGPNPTQPIPKLWTVAHETYNPVIVQGRAVTAAGIAGARTINYGP